MGIQKTFDLFEGYKKLNENYIFEIILVIIVSIFNQKWKWTNFNEI